MKTLNVFIEINNEMVHASSMPLTKELFSASETKNYFELASVEAGLGKKIALSHLDSLADNFENALKSAIEEMCNIGFNDANNLGDDILRSCVFLRLFL